MKNTKQKAKERKIQRNAHNMKNPGGDRLIKREDRLKEMERRKQMKVE